jgi:hypothetical protein
MEDEYFVVVTGRSLLIGSYFSAKEDNLITINFLHSRQTAG